MARLVCGIAPPPSRGTRRSFQDLFAESIFWTTAAGPGDGRFCQACLRVHMSHAANRGGCGAVTGGLDGFREAQILLRRVRGGHSHFNMIRNYAPAWICLSARPACTVW